jgi:hypothetical protein
VEGLVAALAHEADLDDQVGTAQLRGRVVEQPAQDRCGDGERHVAEDTVRLGRRVQGQEVRPDNPHPIAAVAASQRVRQPGVELHRDDPRSGAPERGGQPAEAGADLDHQVSLADAGRGDDLGGDARATKEVPAVAGLRPCAAQSRGHGRSP